MALFALASPSGSTPISYNVVSGGITQVEACLSADCPSGSDVTFDLASAAPVASAGSATIDDVALTLGLTYAVTSLTISGTGDNGVTSIILSGLTFEASDVALVQPAGLGTTYAIGVGASATVSGTVTQLGPGGLVSPPTAFSLTDVSLAGSCIVGAGSLSCTQMFGRQGFALGVGAPGNEQDRFLRVGTALAASAPVPEPSTALLYLLSLAAISRWRTRRLVG